VIAIATAGEDHSRAGPIAIADPATIELVLRNWRRVAFIGLPPLDDAGLLSKR
jgi:hypothetical protein